MIVYKLMADQIVRSRQENKSELSSQPVQAFPQRVDRVLADAFVRAVRSAIDPVPASSHDDDDIDPGKLT